VRIGCLICNYNSWSLAQRCLKAISAVEPGAHVTIVDDCSSDPTESESAAGDYRLIRHRDRRGLAAALNTGIAAIDADVVIHFDADAFPLTPFGDTIRARFVDDGQLGLLGFRCKDENGRETPSLAEPPKLLPFLLGQRLASLARRERAQTGATVQSVPTLAGLAVRRSAFAEVGGFDERLGFLDVDVDFGLRLREGGWGVRQEPTLFVFHVGGGSRLDPGERLERFYADRWRTLLKHRKVRWPRVLRGLVCARLGVEYAALKALMAVPWTSDAKLRSATEGRRRAMTVMGRLVDSVKRPSRWRVGNSDRKRASGDGSK
jgi:GT2 family glycosyltransferase